MATHAMFIDQRGSHGMMMADGAALIAQQVYMHHMVEFHRLIILGHIVQDNCIRLPVRQTWLEKHACKHENRPPAYRFHPTRLHNISFVTVGSETGGSNEQMAYLVLPQKPAYLYLTPLVPTGHYQGHLIFICSFNANTKKYL
jgi:hypothetical protein